MNSAPASGVAAFWHGFKRSLGVPAHLFFVALLQVWFVQVLFSEPMKILKSSIGGSLRGLTLEKSIDLSVVVEAIISNKDKLTFADSAPFVLLTYLVVMSLVQAAVLERIRARKGLPLPELFAAAGNRGLAFLRANVAGGIVLSLGILAVSLGQKAAVKAANLDEIPSEVTSSRISIGVFAATLFVLLFWRTFVDVLKARVLIEESPPLFLPFKNVPSVTRLALRSLGFILKNPLRAFVPTVGNAGLYTVVLLLLRFIIASPEAWITLVLIFVQNFLFTLVHFSFSAGQLTLAESVVTQRSMSAVVVKAARMSVVDQAPAYTAPAGLDFLQHLPDQLPDRRAERASGAMSAVTAVTLPPSVTPPQAVTPPPSSLRPLVSPEVLDEPVERVVVMPPEAAALPPVEAPAPVVEKREQFHFVTQEEMDSGKFPVAEAPLAEAPVSAQLISADAAMAAPPAEDHAATVVLDAAMVQATVAAATAGTPSAPGGRLSAGDLFGDMLHEIGGQTHAEAAPPAVVEQPPSPPVKAPPQEAALPPAPAPPPPMPPPAPPAPKPIATAPWNEPKLSVKDIFGDILEELGGELPDSEKNKPPQKK